VKVIRKKKLLCHIYAIKRRCSIAAFTRIPRRPTYSVSTRFSCDRDFALVSDTCRQHLARGAMLRLAFQWCVVGMALCLGHLS